MYYIYVQNTILYILYIYVQNTSILVRSGTDVSTTCPGLGRDFFIIYFRTDLRSK